MMKNNDTVTPYQVGVVLIMTITSTAMFSLVSILTETAGGDIWLILAIGGLLALAAAFITVTLGKRFPQKTLAEYSQLITGKLIGRLITLLFAIYFVCVMAFLIREFTEVIKMFLLFRTPTEVIMITLILSFTYVVRAGIECVTRVITVIFPIVFIMMALIIIPGVFPLDFSNVLPVFQNVPAKLIASLPGLMLCFGGFETLLFYSGFVKNPKKLYKSVALAMVFITCFYIAVGVICVAAFGDRFASEMIWPLLEFVRDISLPGLFIERLDGIVLSLWIGAIFACCTSLYYISSYSISKVINTKEQKQFVLPMAVVIYYLALQPDDLAQLYAWGEKMFTYVLPVMAIGIPVVLLAIAKFKKLGVKNNEKA